MPTFLLCSFAAVLVSGCGLLASQNSPDVIYSGSAQEARALQVPPDLTDVSNAEQFVVPGTANAAVTRNTLLPQFDTVKFVRSGEQSWLEFRAAPENVWPQLLAFLRSENLTVEQSEPVAGVINTQWQAANKNADGSLFKNLSQSDAAFMRIGFRLERALAGGRLFARSQTADELPATQPWPASSHNPEATSELLSRFLAYVGVEQQRIRGILSDDQASAVLNDAVLQTTASGSEILINKGFGSAFDQVLSAMGSSGFQVTNSDARVGRIEFMQAQELLVLRLSPLHISAVRAGVTGPDGARLELAQERELLSSVLQLLV